MYGDQRQARPRGRGRRFLRRNPILVSFFALVVVGTTVLAGNAVAGAGSGIQAVPFEIQTLDGSGNNVANPTWGQSGRPYARVAPARYADGISVPPAGPNTRRASNRLHNDVNQNVFSERQVGQWGFVWGQFIDHTFGLRDEAGTAANIPFNAGDPLEDFTNTLGNIPFTRSAAAPGTGTSTANPRQQTNTVSSYIDAFPVYGGTAARLDWLRNGSNDGNPTNNDATLLMPNNYLPRRDARGNPAAAPTMAIDGRLLANPNSASVAGDVRASENIELNATHTLFAREHNRIVSLLPTSLSQEDRFQIARRIVIAEQQFITYNEWLPAMGINLPAYTGYNPGVNATLTNEFATTGYRAHSMIHGEFEVETDADRYTQAQLDAFEAGGVEVAVDGDEVALAIPLNVAFFNPTLVPAIGLGPLMQALSLEPQYKNDEQIDNQLRSVLFQVPVSGNPECLDGPTLPECFQGVVDLGAIDIERDRDHGIPTYNQLRVAYGLPARTSFTQITGESTATFPAGSGVDNPNSLDFDQLVDVFGVSFPVDEARDPVRAVRHSTTAARLSALYGGNINNVDAFAGMVAEPHQAGGEFGELQRAIWNREFSRLRDGDRFFYGNQTSALDFIRNTYGIDYRRNLGDIIASNTDIPRTELAPNVFFVDGQVPPTSCRVTYRVVSQWTNAFEADMSITNTGSKPLDGWNLRFTFPNGQTVTQLWNGVVAQTGADVPVTNATWNGVLAPGQTLTGVGFIGSWNNVTNNRPARFSLNTTNCTIG